MAVFDILLGLPPLAITVSSQKLFVADAFAGGGL